MNTQDEQRAVELARHIRNARTQIDYHTEKEKAAKEELYNLLALAGLKKFPVPGVGTATIVEPSSPTKAKLSLPKVKEGLLTRGVVPSTIEAAWSPDRALVLLGVPQSTVDSAWEAATTQVPNKSYLTFKIAQ